VNFTHFLLRAAKLAGIGAGREKEREVPLPKIDKAPTTSSALTVVAIIKNEGAYLEEWFQFHMGVGVDRFIIYDNDSTDNGPEIIKKYVAKGIAEYIPWPHFCADRYTQSLAYAHALCQFGSQAEWMAFIDLDEFLFSPLDQDMNRVLKNYRDVPAIAAFWVMFGTSGHKVRPPGSVLQSYTRRYRSPNSSEGRTMRNFKSIVQPSRVTAVLGGHSFRTDLGLPVAVDENRNPVFHRKSAVHSAEIFRINHYYTRSEEDFRRKVARGSVNIAGEREKKNREHRLRDFALIESDSEEDTTILRQWQHARNNSI
jgi:hypothetical protein